MVTTIYYCVSTIVCFIFLMLAPTKMDPSSNRTGSIVLSFILGWIIWPFAFLAWLVTKRKGKKPNVN